MKQFQRIFLESGNARGLLLDELDGFLIKMQTLDETVSDFASPITDKCSGKYEMNFVYIPLDSSPTCL